MVIVIYHPSGTVICYNMKTLSAFGNRVFLFCGVKNILASKASVISTKDKLTQLFFFWGWYLGGCPTPCCPYAGVKKMEQVCAHVVLVRSYITVPLSFTSCPVSLFFPPSFPNFFPLFSLTCFFPLFFLLSLPPFIKPFWLQVLLSLPIIFSSSNSFLPSSFQRFPFLSRTLPPCLHVCLLHPSRPFFLHLKSLFICPSFSTFSF